MTMPPIKILDKRTVPSGGEASHTFSGIDVLVAQWDATAGVTSRHLMIMINGTGETAAAEIAVELQLNGLATAIYNDQQLKGANVTDSAAIATGQTSLTVGLISAANASNAFGGGMILIPHAFNAVNHKAVLALTGAHENGVMAVAGRVALTAAITSVLVKPATGDFAANTEIILAVVDETFNIGESILTGAASFDFDSIRQVEGDLVAIGYLRGSSAAVTDTLAHDINADATVGNYGRLYLRGIGSATAAATAADKLIGFIVGKNAGANEFSPFIGQYSNYADGINHPHYLTLSGLHESTPSGAAYSVSGRRKNVAAITQLEFFGAGGAGNFEAGSMMSLYVVPKRLLKRVKLTATATSITFNKNDIPGWRNNEFEALQINIYARTDVAALTDGIDLELNDDAVAADYDTQYLQGAGAAVTAARSAASQQIGVCSGNTAGANEFSGGSFLLPSYSRTDRHKHIEALTGIVEDMVQLLSARWESLNGIIKIELTPTTGPNFMIGTVAELVGVLPRTNDYRIWLEDNDEDNNRIVNLYDSDDQKTLEAAMSLPTPQIQAGFIGERSLASAHYKARTVRVPIKIVGSTVGDLQTNVRSMQRMLDDSRSRNLLKTMTPKYGSPVTFGLRVGSVADEALLFDLLHGRLELPRNFLSTYLDNHQTLVNAILNLQCGPVARRSNVPLVPQTCDNCQETGLVNYIDIDTAELVGDIPARLYLMINQIAAAGTKNFYVAKRSGIRYDDDLWTEGEDESAFADLDTGAGTTVTNTSQALATASSNLYARARMNITAGAVANEEKGRWDYDIVNPPRGLFRVLIYAEVSHNSPANWANMVWGLGWSYGAKSLTPSYAAGDYVANAANLTWELLELGTISIPPTSESEIALNNTLQLQIYAYLAANTGIGAAADLDWNLDYVFLLPIDEGYIAAQNIISTDVLAMDGISTPGQLFILDTDDEISDYPSPAGKLFTMGREKTRIYVLRDDVPPTAKFELYPTIQPQFLTI